MTSYANTCWGTGLRAVLTMALSLACLPNLFAQEQPDSLTAEELQLVRDVEEARIRVIEKVVGSVIAIYGPSRQGGGSGVIIDPSGIALTNHHVIEGAGLHGFGGLADGELYEWDLIGTDPGGDVAIIKMKGKDEFPSSPLGDSDKVKVGDWALAMGNPFLLAHDQVPTVTLGVVSGVERFQEGAGNYQLVYGNCIQIDSSINPGNSGGPLFNMDGEVIGINGRGSFRDRGRVNVGLGYAISSNQIKNFIPDLLATKIVEHGTLDANFSNRGGKVVCSTINLDSTAAEAGLELGDELIEFEGRPISYANQFKNLVCILPEDWPAHLVVRKEDGRELAISVRMFGLPYNYQDDEEPADDEQPDDDDEKGEGDESEGDEGEQDDEGEDDEGDDDDVPEIPRGDNEDLKKYLLNEPGTVVDYDLNLESVNYLFGKWKQDTVPGDEIGDVVFRIEDEIRDGDKAIGSQTIHVAADGRFRVALQLEDQAAEEFLFDGEKFWTIGESSDTELSLIRAKINPVVTQGLALAAAMQEQPFGVFGKPVLDGGDKALGQISSRIMMLDEDEDWFYAWLSLYDAAGHQQTRLLKISSDRDCGRRSRGMTFDDYRDIDGMAVPFLKQLVSGLNEKAHWVAVTSSFEQVTNPDSGLFVARKDTGE